MIPTLHPINSIQICVHFCRTIYTSYSCMCNTNRSDADFKYYILNLLKIGNLFRVQFFGE